MTQHTHGLWTWVLQRMSAVYLAGFLVYLIIHFLPGGAHSYDQWQAWLSRPLVNICAAGFILALLVHGWVGMRDVVLDYIHPVALRLAVLGAVGLVLAGSGLWALRSLLLVTV